MGEPYNLSDSSFLARRFWPLPSHITHTSHGRIAMAIQIQTNVRACVCECVCHIFATFCVPLLLRTQLHLVITLRRAIY